jgi:uncharacterized protein YneF (UPF0154 family)
MSEETRTVGQQSKRAAVVIGRFNPPTIGHYAVMTAVKKFIKNNPELKLEAVPIVVVVEGEKTSKDKNRNPLSGDDRIAFMTASGKADGIKFLKAGSAMDAFHAVRRAGFEPIAVAGGTDRAENYLQMLDKYFKTDGGKPIEHKLIELPRGGSNAKTNEGIDSDASLADVLKYTDKDLPISMVSASLARLAVKKGEREKFAIIVGLTDKPDLANKMFNKIKAAMETQDA